jgi:hypothetical protein
MRLNSDFRDLLSALSAAEARYLVVGGYAVAFHSEPRFTKDLDIWIAADADNARRVHSALAAFGAPVSGLSATEFTEPGIVLQIGVPPNRVDVLTSVDGITFEEAWPRRVEGAFGGERMWVIGRDDLLRSKRATGRPQDLADVAALERAR